MPEMEVGIYPDPEYIFYALTITADIPIPLIKCQVILHCFSYITSFKSHSNSVIEIIFIYFYYLSFIDEIMKDSKVK